MVYTCNLISWHVRYRVYIRIPVLCWNEPKSVTCMVMKTKYPTQPSSTSSTTKLNSWIFFLAKNNIHFFVYYSLVSTNQTDEISHNEKLVNVSASFCNNLRHRLYARVFVWNDFSMFLASLKLFIGHWLRIIYFLCFFAHKSLIDVHILT